MFNLISKHRRSLMAISMLWIGCYHQHHDLSIKAFNYLFHTLGYFGVDCFMFLSGFGIYYSLKKDSKYFNFIKKRLRRILPYCVPLYIINYLLGNETLSRTILDCFGLSILFRPDFINWFTSIILLLYAVTPLYFKLFSKKPLLFTLITILIVSSLCIYHNQFEFTYIYFRITIYVLGIYFAYLLDSSKLQNKIYSYVVIMLCVFGFALVYFLTHFYRNDIMYIYPSIIIVPGFLLIVGFVIDKIKILQPVLDFSGKYTYQFYLFNKPLFDFVTDNFYKKFYVSNIVYDFAFNYLTIIESFILAYLYKEIIDFIINVIIRKKAKRL